MSDSSDVEIVSVSGILSNVPNKSAEDIEFTNSSDDYEEDPQVSGMKAIKLARSELVKDQRSHLAKLFDFLQDVILNGQGAEGSWKRTTTVTKALKVCQDLVAEEDKLKLELEILLQENWKLKKKFGRISNRRKRKTGCTTLTRKVSSLSLCSPQLIVSENKTTPMDDTEVKVKTDAEASPTLPTAEAKCEEKKKCDVTPRPLRRRYKKRTGLSEEEKEFHMLKEKIEDILFEVDTLWNEVKDEEEFESKEDISILNKVVRGGANVEPVKEQSSESSQAIVESTSLAVSSEITSSAASKKEENRRLISVADITKLMAPQFVKKQLESSTTIEGSKSNFGCFNSNADDSSDDENPRLVIDEGDSPKNSDHEADAIEAFQAVGTICRNLITGNKANSEQKVDPSKPKEADNSKKKESANISDGSQSDSSVIFIE